MNASIYATYNIVSNRLFFWPEKDTRLPAEEYKKFKDAGFVWWPRGCFTAIWSPTAEDLLHEYVDEITENDDPDDLQRRVERFEKYAAQAERDTESASDRIAGANTARRLRFALEGEKKSIEAAQHWNQRIAGAISNAAHKDSPRTIANRIKGIQADLRRNQKNLNQYEGHKEVMQLAPVDGELLPRLVRAYNYQDWQDLEAGKITREEAKNKEIGRVERVINHYTRWVAHLLKRIEYESAYLDAVGGAELIEPKARRVAVAPDDGIKKGVMVTVPRGGSWQKETYTGKVISCGAHTLKIELTKEQDPNGYYKKGFQAYRRFAKLAEVKE